MSRPARVAPSAKALALVFAIALVATCLAPLVAAPLGGSAALWVVTKDALVRVGPDSGDTQRTTDPVPGAYASAVRVRGNRIVTARLEALTSHALTPEPELGEGTTLAMDPAHVYGLAVSRGAERIWLARRVPPEPTDAPTDDGSAPERYARVTAFSEDLTPDWQHELGGRVVALAAATDRPDVAVWALQVRRIVGLDNTGTPVADIELPLEYQARTFAPLGDDRFAVANVPGVWIFDADGNMLHQHSEVGVNSLHPVVGDRIWAVGGYSLLLLDDHLHVLQSYDLPAQGIDQYVTAATSDPRDHNLWFTAGRALYHASIDGQVQLQRDELEPYLDNDPITELALYADTFAPELTVELPAGPLVTNNDQPDLVLGYSDTGIGVDTDTFTAVRDGEPIDGACNIDAEAEHIDCAIGPLADGVHEITATVADYAGNESEPVTATFEIDTAPPGIMVESPADGAFVNTDTITVHGHLSETAELTIDGAPVGLDIDDRFEHMVALSADGTRAIALVATDGAGNETTRTVTVTRDTVAPPAVVTTGIAVEAGEEAGTVRITGADGSVEPGAEVDITNTRTDETVTVVANGDGAFVATIDGEIGDSFSIRVRDRAGNESDPAEVGSGGGDIPPDPVDVAPPLPETGTPPFEEQISFLYEGADPIQRGAEPGTIDAERVSVLRGAVRNRAGEPIPGVTIRILDHPELGHTATRADGGFDLAVNGGGHLTVEYRKDGYLPVQRTVGTRWNGWHHAPDVVMIPLDEKVTTIDLADNSQPFQVARGSEVTDSDGTRRATVLFPAGTTAEITRPDGTKQQLTELDVRATEYTVGDTGPAAMPGELPPASAYTYAVELSVDQALEQGVKVAGKDVVFNQPVPVYVDNFLDFPIGEPVPVGYYDNDAAAWIPHDNGRIIGVLDEQGGTAVLDVTGDGEAATPEELDELGITAAERAQLAELHDPGDSLWRFATTHLSTWDCNWPYGPPDDGTRPLTPLPETLEAQEPDNSDEEDPCEGCVISPQKQSLGESINVAGTPYTLHYQSNRVPGSADNRVKIPLTGDEIPDSLSKVRLEIRIAGRTSIREFSPEPSLNHEFAWDGLDAFGRERYGHETATIELTYVYPCQYYGSVGSANLTGGGSVFGRFGNVANPIGTRSRCQGFEFPRESTVVVESPLTAQGTIGNWTLSSIHEYSPQSGLMLMGDGVSRRLSSDISTVAGDSSTGSNGFSGDGGPATEARLNFAEDVTFAPDGSIYIADTSNNRIRKIAPNGVINTVAGDGSFGSSGDGGLAIEAQLKSPVDVAIGPEGGLYITEPGSHSIRRVTVDGNIDTVAGDGTRGFNGDNGPATQAQLNFPNATAVGPDRTLYIADTFNHRIRRVTPRGRIQTIAGTGTSGFSGDGGPATEAELSYPASVAIGFDGSLYIADTSNYRIRKVTPDGTIKTVAGSGTSGYSGDGGPALDARFVPWDVTEGSDGSLYIGDGSNHVIRRVTPDGLIETIVGTGNRGFSNDGSAPMEVDIAGARSVEIGPSGSLYYTESGNALVRRVSLAVLPTTQEGHSVIASSTKKRALVFDATGQHVRTVNSSTSNPLLVFDRDGKGYVTSISDTDGNVTVIERDNAGTATAIVAPDGQRTDVSVDGSGHLTRFTDPTGATWSMDYTTDGLLTRLEKPGDAVNTFAWDEQGRLIEDIDPNGGGWQLARSELDDGYRTEMISGEGRMYRFTTERPDAFTRVYTNEAPDGTVTRRTHTDSTTTLERADGTVVTTEEAPDPRFGFAAPYVAERRIETPAGRTLQQATERTAELADPVDPMSLEQLHETSTTNGRTRTVEYDAATRRWTAASPEGRGVTTHIDEQGRPLVQTVPDIAPVHTSYDDRGRPASVEQGEGANARATTFAYHGSGNQAGYLASVTDALGRSVSFETDAAGRITEQTLPDGRTIGYQYDDRGNLIALVPPGREAHVFEYDGLDQRTGYTPPDLEGTETVTRHVYNLDRQIRRIERPGDEAVTFDYDSGGRLVTRSMPAGDTTYTHEATTGQVRSITAPGGIGLQFQWDGFLPVRTEWTGPVSGTVSRDFDHSFWLTGESVNGTPITFDYDDDGLLTDAGDLSLARDAGNGLVTGTTQQAIEGSRGYNDFGELTDRTVTTNGTTVYDVAYTRDKLGRIVEETETIDGESRAWEYDYDAAGRLTEVRRNGTPVHLYSYDANGNRTSHTGPAGTRTGAYDAQDRITSYSDATYTHTPAGERTTKTAAEGTTEYDYDAAGNLREVVLPDGTTIEYLIDGQDRRIGKVVDGTLQKGWLYRNQLNPVAQLDADGNVTHRFVYADKPNVPAYMIKDGTTYRIVSDHLGSVRLVIDTETNEVVQRMDYGPFGTVATDTNPGFQPFGFAGGLYDRDTGLTRFGARDYDAEIGRWTAKDPILFNGSPANLYGYSFADPINWFDANGLAPNPSTRPSRSGGSTIVRPGSTGPAVRGPYHSPPSMADKAGRFGAKQAAKGVANSVSQGAGTFITRSPAMFLVTGIFTPSEIGTHPCEMPGGPSCFPEEPEDPCE